MAIRQLEEIRAEVENQYTRRDPGVCRSPAAGLAVFEWGPQVAGRGQIPMSGYRLRHSTRVSTPSRSSTWRHPTNEHPACVAARS
jgi:hypothetical protein